MFEQIVHGFVAEAFQVQRRTMRKGPSGTHGVDAGQKAACPFQHLPVVQLGAAPAAPGTDAEQKARMLMHGLPLQHQRRNHGNFPVRQLLGEGVLFLDLDAAPAAGAVELGDDLVALVLVGQIDAVLIGAQRRQPSVRHKARAAQRIDHAVRREVRIGVRGVLCIAHPCIVRPKQASPGRTGLRIRRQDCF